MTSTATLTESLTYAQLVAKIQASELKKGASYTITDFATAHYMLDGDGDVLLDGNLDPIVNIGAIEPLTVKAATPNSLFKEAFSSDYPQDTIYYDWNPENWKYDLAFSGWAEDVLPEWKGSIFFRHDTFNDVSMGHDWRKVLNRRWKMNYDAYSAETTYAEGDKVQVVGDGVYVSLQDSNMGNAVLNELYWTKIINYVTTAYFCAKLSQAQDAEDYIDVPCFYSQEVDPEGQYRREVRSVIILPYADNTQLFWCAATILSNNVFVLEPENGWFQYSYLHFGKYAFQNTFFSSFCMHNNISNDFCYNIIGGGSFDYNNIGIGCYNNIIYMAESNSIGGSFMENAIGNLFTFNTIGDAFQHNTIGKQFKYNTVGNAVKKTTIGNGFTMNKVCDKFNFGTTPLVMTTATHVYAKYNCELFIRADGTQKLSYINNSDELIIVDATA